VATSIIKQTAVSKRVAAMLDGESLLNDATALVLLRTAIVAATASFSLWGSVGRFAYSVALAVLIGWVVGRLNLIVRRRVNDPTVNTVISFAVPFIASVPAGLLGGSGLVAAVVAGIVTGIRAPRELSSRNRLSDSQNWRTVELVLEGAVFLTMGVQLTSIVSAVEQDHAGVGTAVLVAAGALALTILVRAAYIAPLLRVLHGLSRRTDRLQTRLLDMRERMSTSEGKQETLDELNARRGFKTSERDLERFSVRITRGLAGAGMRGAVTVAAAQTLPDDTPQRSVLVLVAFGVAVLSLLVQGGTIGPIVRSITAKVDQAAIDAKGKEELDRIFDLLKTSAETVPDAYRGRDRTPEGFEEAKRVRLAVLAAQRSALLDARDNGTFDADVLETALANLDASEITIEMRGRLAG
jgi:CPA1 family monovalent cation:H+ antiporter